MNSSYNHPFPLFVSGIGTGIGKTLVAAIVAEALGAYYWKPVQAGTQELTDPDRVRNLLSDATGRVLPSYYELEMPASPHLAAKAEGIEISIAALKNRLGQIWPPPGKQGASVIIEGAGGIMVPLNDKEFVGDLILALGAKLILVSRNYLGSINHSLLTAAYCRQQGIPVLGWIFNDRFMDYETEIAAWSGYPVLGSIPWTENPDPAFVREQAIHFRHSIRERL